MTTVYNIMQVFKQRDPSHDYCDGEIYKNHPLFSTHQDALQLIIYFDEIETANPLGSYRGYHKLGKLKSFFQGVTMTF